MLIVNMMHDVQLLLYKIESSAGTARLLIMYRAQDMSRQGLCDVITLGARHYGLRVCSIGVYLLIHRCESKCDSGLNTIHTYVS